MRRVDLIEGAPANGDVEVADVVDGEMNSFASSMEQVFEREGFTAVKTEGMNAKRLQKSNTAARYMRTYTKDDICDPPEIKSMTDALSRDAPRDRTHHDQVEHDKMVKATLAHNNYRADPELQKHGQPHVIAVRRIACLCAGCRAHLNLPVSDRYKPHDDCEYADIFGRWNDWKLVTLHPGSEDAAAEMEEDDALHLQVCVHARERAKRHDCMNVQVCVWRASNHICVRKCPFPTCRTELT